MKAERYLLDYILKNGISVERIHREMGLDMELICKEKKELSADDFVHLCIYLEVNPDDIMKSIV